MKIINTRAELSALRDELRLREDWHEPDERDVTVSVELGVFDNAMCQPDGGEIAIQIRQDDVPIAWVNLALLFAFATGFEGI
jgi:hypothetical protein